MTTPRTPVETVRTFLLALQDADTDAALALLAPEASWANTGLPTLRGRRARGALRSMAERGVGFEVVIHHIAGDGAVVLTDRTDVLILGRVRSTFRVCGTFEVHDGLITRWDDHYSPLGLAFATLRGAVAALRP